MKYTKIDISATLGVSLRTVQRYIESLTIVENGENFLNEDVFNLMILRRQNDKN